MTATDLGLPTSPVVDPKGHLTPEWLHALGKIEKLHSLKQQQAATKAIDLSALTAELSGIETAFEALLETIKPNIALFTEIPPASVPDLAGTGVSHLLGTEDYIAMHRVGPGALRPVSLSSSDEGAIAIKNASVWTFNGSAGTGLFTLSANF